MNNYSVIYAAISTVIALLLVLLLSIHRDGVLIDLLEATEQIIDEMSEDMDKQCRETGQYIVTDNTAIPCKEIK